MPSITIFVRSLSCGEGNESKEQECRYTKAIKFYDETGKLQNLELLVTLKQWCTMSGLQATSSLLLVVMQPATQ